MGSARKTNQEVEVEEELAVNALEGVSRKRVLDKANSDRRTQLLKEDLEQNGYRISDELVLETELDGESEQVTVVYEIVDEKSDTDWQGVVYWTNRPDTRSRPVGNDSVEIPPVGSIEMILNDKERKIVHKTTSSGEITLLEETVTPTDHDVTIEAGIGDPCSSDDDCTSAGACCEPRLECESYNISCIAGIILSSGAIIAGCGSCINAAGWLSGSCKICFAAVTGGSLTGLPCSPGNDCTQISRCNSARQCQGFS